MTNTYIGKSETNQRLMEIITIAEKTKSSIIIWGEAGIGKTQLIKNLAMIRNLIANGINPGDSKALKKVNIDALEEKYPIRILIGATIEPSELVGLPALETITTKTGITAPITRNTMPSWAYDLIEAGQGILFLDELNSAPPSVQAAELSLLQGRMVGQYKLPDDVLIIAAANPTDIAVNGWNLPSPLSNRLLHIHMEPNVDDFLEGFRIGWGEDISIIEKGLRKNIADFLTRNQTLIQTRPKNDVEGGKAWASRRSWDNAAKNMALTGDIQTQEMILMGYVGLEASQSYFIHRTTAALPSVSEVLDGDVDLSVLPVDAIDNIIRGVIADVKPFSIEKSVSFFISLVEANKGDLAQTHFSDFILRAKEINPTVETSVFAKYYEANKEDNKYLNN